MELHLHAVHDCLERLDELGDPWQEIDRLVDFEAFREPLEEHWRKTNQEKAKNGTQDENEVEAGSGEQTGGGKQEKGAKQADNDEKANDDNQNKSEAELFSGEQTGGGGQEKGAEPADDDKEDKGGRPAFDAVFMFKILLIKRKLNLSYASTEHALVTRLDLRRFLGPIILQGVPGASTIHRYEDGLDDEIVRDVFELFDKQLCDAGYKTKGGQMVDSSFVLANIQRNSKEENDTIKKGETPESWKEDKATAKLRQKDVDARWSKKRGKNYYGYKNHICADVDNKLIRGYVCTPANHHDHTVAEALMNSDMQDGYYADAAYRSKEVERALRTRRIKSKVAFKRSKGEELTQYKKRENKKRAKVRARVEHIFGSCQNELGGKFVRTIGLDHASVQVGLQVVLYNMCRLVSLKRTAAC